MVLRPKEEIELRPRALGRIAHWLSPLTRGMYFPTRSARGMSSSSSLKRPLCQNVGARRTHLQRASLPTLCLTWLEPAAGKDTRGGERGRGHRPAIQGLSRVAALGLGQRRDLCTPAWSRCLWESNGLPSDVLEASFGPKLSQICAACRSQSEAQRLRFLLGLFLQTHCVGGCVGPACSELRIRFGNRFIQSTPVKILCKEVCRGFRPQNL